MKCSDRSTASNNPMKFMEEYDQFGNVVAYIVNNDPAHPESWALVYEADARQTVRVRANDPRSAYSCEGIPSL